MEIQRLAVAGYLCFLAQMSIDARPVAVVLGAAVWSGGRPSPTLRRRALHAAGLWKAGIVQKIVACGGLGEHGPSEAVVIAQLCQEQGVPSTAILLEDKSTTTEENIRFAKTLLDCEEVNDVVIVTDRYHAPRARLMARRLGWQARSDSPPLPKGRRSRVIRQVVREVPAYLWYWLSKR